MIRVLPLVLLAISQPVQGDEVQDLVEAGRVHIRAYAEPAENIYLGQQVRVYVEVLTDTWFTTAPRYPELQVDGAIALQPERFSSNLTRSLDGQEFTGQRHTYLVYPQRTEDLMIPSVDVDFAVATDGKPGRSVRMATPAFRLNIMAPPGTQNLDRFVTTPSLRVIDRWSGSLDGLETGDALTRTITVEADDTQALLLPSPEFAAVTGLAVYPGTPRLENTAERGRYSGQRVDEVSYVMEQAGEYSLPGWEIYWWDPRNRRLNRENIDPVIFSVAVSRAHAQDSGAPNYSTLGGSLDDAVRVTLDWLSDNLIALSLGLGTVYLLILIARRTAPLISGWLGERSRDRNEKEAHYFEALMRSCRQTEETQLVRTFWAWIRKSAEELGVSERDLLQLAGKPSSPAMSRLLADRYKLGHHRPINRKALASDLRRLRREFQRIDHHNAPSRPARDSLNPRTGPVTARQHAG